MPSWLPWVPGPHGTGEEATGHLAKASCPRSGATGPTPWPTSRAGAGSGRDRPREGSGGGWHRPECGSRQSSHHPSQLAISVSVSAWFPSCRVRPPVPAGGGKQLQKQSLGSPAFASTCGAQASCRPRPLPTSALAPRPGWRGMDFLPAQASWPWHPHPHWDRGTLAPHTHTGYWSQV